MPNLIIVTRDGEEHEVEATLGISVMEIIRDAGFDELGALCGGCCSCATCHVHIDAAFFDLVGRAGNDEGDLLDGSIHRTEASRLSCQVEFGPHLDGMRVRIAQED